MDKRDPKMRRRAGVVLAGLLGLVSIGSAAINTPIANAVADVKTDRVAGADRFDTAAKMATAAYPTGAANVVVASGRSFADALAGAALAGAKAGPLLLTDPNSVPAATDAALTTLKATTVFLLGGTAAISQAVQDTLAAKYTVRRISGADRYATAAAIGTEIGLANVGLLAAKRTAFVATGLDFADALAGGPLAAAGASPTGVHPVLLVNNDVPKATSDAITALGIQQVVILGGTGAVSNTVETKLETATGGPAVRYAGTDRFDTATKIAAAALKDFSSTFGGTSMLLANGTVFADALAGGPYGAVKGSPVVLTNAASLPDATNGFLQTQSAKVATITALGGTAAVSDATLLAAEKAAESAPTRGNEALSVTPVTVEAVANSGTRSFAASGLGTNPVAIALVECSRIFVVSGSTVFANANSNTMADGTKRAASATENTTTPNADTADVPAARLAAVNGAPVTATNGTAKLDFFRGATPVNGTVTFDIAGPGIQDTTTTVCVQPVVFVDTNQDDALTGAGSPRLTPNEQFGTGGKTVFSPGVAASGPIRVNVNQASGTSQSFNGCALSSEPNQNGPEVASPTCVTFVWDENDVFQYDGSTIDLGTFAARVSPGDDVVGTYDTDTGKASTFNLLDEAPTPPTGVTLSAVAAHNLVTWTKSVADRSPDDARWVSNYRVYRDDTVAADATACSSTLGDYVLVGTVNAGVTRFEDSSATIQTGTKYCYAVAAFNQTAGDTNREGPPAFASSPVTGQESEVGAAASGASDDASAAGEDAGTTASSVFTTTTTEPGGGGS